jgi:hypothetical protein
MLCATCGQDKPPSVQPMQGRTNAGGEGAPAEARFAYVCSCGAVLGPATPGASAPIQGVVPLFDDETPGEGGVQRAVLQRQAVASQGPAAASPWPLAPVVPPREAFTAAAAAVPYTQSDYDRARQPPSDPLTQLEARLVYVEDTIDALTLERKKLRRILKAAGPRHRAIPSNVVPLEAAKG